ncbi:MAG TPA: GTPase-associated system all-helical protein GASH [Bryobacteraceae bacterium]|jgi:hypothetical protein
MHPHLVDWFRNVHIQSDPKVLQKRWDAAVGYGKTLTRGNASRLLKLFLFSSSDPAQVKSFTDELLVLDAEFPVTGNVEELRLMAGVVMVTFFDRGSHEADAFALGLRCMSFPNRSTQPAQPEILSEAEKYLRAETERRRPIEFEDPTPGAEKTLGAKYKEVEETEAAGDAATILVARGNYQKAIVRLIQSNHTLVTGQIKRLAEESAFLWWVLGEYSPSLQLRSAKLNIVDYTLIAAAEAAERTHILPPPSSAAALLARALAPCEKVVSTKALKLADFLAKTDNAWRAEYTPQLALSDCAEFVPFATGLTKAEEFQDPAAAVKVLPKICLGLDMKHGLSPEQAANQFYTELAFLRALALLGEN